MRPTGIVDPEVEVRETRNQIDDLMNEIRRREQANERVLVIFGAVGVLTRSDDPQRRALGHHRQQVVHRGVQHLRRDHHGLQPRYKILCQVAVATVVGTVLLVMSFMSVIVGNNETIADGALLPSRTPLTERDPVTRAALRHVALDN